MGKFLRDFIVKNVFCQFIKLIYIRHWRMKLLKVRAQATLLKWSNFLLQKLNSYEEALNLRGTMAPLAPYFCRLWN